MKGAALADTFLNAAYLGARMTERLRKMQASKLATLLHALDGVELSDDERRTIEWLATWDHETVTNVAAVITRARLLREGTHSGSSASRTSLRT